MKQYLGVKQYFGVAIALGFLTAPAFAADLPPVTTEPPAPAYTAPAFSWAGPYAGIHLGYGFASKFENDGGISLDGASGLFGGIQAGYNFTYDPFVFGIEGEMSYANITDSDATVDAKIDWKGSITPRIGYAFDRFLPYIKGGFAFGNAEITDGAFSESKTHVGWTLGTGMEYAITPNFTAKIEYMYTDLGSETYDVGTPISAGFKGSDIKLGINYKF